jgi:thiol-disulfide isomerase/thioredoxin
MKTKIFILTLISICMAFQLSAQFEDGVLTDTLTGERMLYGEFDEIVILENEFNDWYTPGYENYEPQQENIISLKEIKAAEYEYTIVLGSWCPDSRHEVPRIMKVLNQIGVSTSSVRFIGVDHQKQAGVADIEDLHIEKVPTLIVFEGKKEIGRIVETPDVSIEDDLQRILSQPFE